MKLDGFETAMVEAIRKRLQAQIGSIRHPYTGETPTVVLVGSDLNDLKIQVEGSEELLKLVRERLGVETDGMKLIPTNSKPIRVFVSYASQDRQVAQRIAEKFHAHGIDTWWDGWEIRSGDSLRQKIDEGLEGCTHFVALLSTNSIDKPWVRTEMDAAFVRKLSNECVFIPLRLGLPVELLPPTLRGLSSPETDEALCGLDQVESDIRGLTRKPTVLPEVTDATSTVNTGYSKAATMIAKWFVENSEKGNWGDPQTNSLQLGETLGMTSDDVTDAVYELRAFVKDADYYIVPTQFLFSEFDQFWMPWNPANDALELAANLVNTTDYPSSTEEIALKTGWSARRLNAAASWLIRRELVDESNTISSEFVSIFLRKTDATRRFVKSRST